MDKGFLNRQIIILFPEFNIKKYISDESNNGPIKIIIGNDFTNASINLSPFKKNEMNQ